MTLLGVEVTAIDLGGLLRRVDELVVSSGTVAYANVHVLNAAVDDPDLRAFLNSVDVCYCDGAGVVLGARILGGRLPERLTGADWIWDLAAHAEGRYRLFWMGSEPGVTAAAALALQARHPQLEVVTDHGFHAKDGPENNALIERINASGAQILLVGMGTPVQERWVAQNRARLTVPVVWVLGATADFVSGRVRRGPAFLFNNQEWLARLWVDPKRLWRRYLVGNPVFVARVLKQRWAS